MGIVINNQINGGRRSARLQCQPGALISGHLHHHLHMRSDISDEFDEPGASPFIQLAQTEVRSHYPLDHHS